MSKNETSFEEREARTGYSFIVMLSHAYDSSEDNEKYAGISLDDWVSMIDSRIDNIIDKYSKELNFMAYIYHDKDKPENEQEADEKGVHIHFLVQFKEDEAKTYRKTIGEVREIFGASNNEKNVQKVDTLTGSSRYLTHRTEDAMNEGKYPYDMSEVKIVNFKDEDMTYRDMINVNYWGTGENNYVSSKKAEKIMLDLSEKVFKGELRKEVALDILGDEAGYKYRKQYRRSFDDDQKEFINKRVKDLSENGRMNQNIYIMGAGGIGKTNLGRKLGVKLSEGKGFYVTAPLGVSKTPDALNHYTDEMVALYNEISPKGWTLDEFNACFDFYEYAPFPARNENKHFVGHTSIFTNSISPLRFAKDLLIYEKGGSEYQNPANKREIDMSNPTAVDKYWQVRRRLKHLIVLVRDEDNDDLVHGHVFNLRYGIMGEDGSFIKDQGTHVRVGEITFESKPKEEPTITNETLDELIALFEVDVNETHNEKEFKTIELFLEENNLVEVTSNDVIDSFVDEVISELKWDLLPTEFLYDLYKNYVERFYPTEKLLNIKEFIYSLELNLDGWERTENAVRSLNKMDSDEPFITEYNLTRWTDQNYKGSDLTKKRDFKRKERYRGFLRK